MANRYIKKVERICGEEKSYIVLLKYNFAHEAINKIISKGEVVEKFYGMMFKVKYRDIEMSIFRSGRIILKGVENTEELKKLLDEILADNGGDEVE